MCRMRLNERYQRDFFGVVPYFSENTSKSAHTKLHYCYTHKKQAAKIKSYQTCTASFFILAMLE